jgi:CHAT domain-containing protein
VEAAARQAVETGNSRLAAESFIAEEFNRALSLRETEALAPVWRQKLPPEYWETLNRLRAADARKLRGGGDSGEARRLRLELSQMETIAGIGFSLSKSENFLSLDSLTRLQKVLRPSELLLSFHVGERESFLWAVTEKGLGLYRLEPEQRIAERVRAFRDSVTRGGGELERLGSELYESLFGQLEPKEADRQSWLVSEEGPLFEVPLAALVRRGGSGTVRSMQDKPEYLVERNSVQFVPGALLLRDAAGRAGVPGRMVAVGDPIYNTADARYKRTAWFSGREFWGQPGGQLSRLAGSAHEVAASAQAWGSTENSNPAVVLTGTASSRGRFLDSLEPSPAVIHLATHVLTPPQAPNQAFVAFSLDSTGQPELLATSDIAKLRVPGTLVVMSGCATAAGESREGAGLLGLTRAWLTAGASGAIATAWPVEDSAGDLLPSFYRYWKTSSVGTNAAEALRRSQVDMIRAGGWRAAPSYWAAYQLTGGER